MSSLQQTDYRMGVNAPQVYLPYSTGALTPGVVQRHGELGNVGCVVYEVNPS